MVEIFFKLVDTIIELLKQKQQDKTQVFKEIIEPLFNDMTLVVQDYFRLFQEAEDSYFKWLMKRDEEPKINHNHDTDLELRDVVNNIKERREELLHARIKIREMANLIKLEFEDDLINDYADKILRYFYSSQIHPTYPYIKSDSFILVELFELLEDAELEDSELRALRYNLQSARNKFEMSWSEITRVYALLRIKYLLPQKKGLKHSQNYTRKFRK